MLTEMYPLSCRGEEMCWGCEWGGNFREREIACFDKSVYIKFENTFVKTSNLFLFDKEIQRIGEIKSSTLFTSNHTTNTLIKVYNFKFIRKIKYFQY